MLLGMDIPMLYMVTVVSAMLDSLLMVSLGTVTDTDTVCRTRNKQFDGYCVYIALPAFCRIN